jgi:anti-sigma-K factor RskA
MHLSPDALVDLAERTANDADVPHLRTCERCRRQLDELRTMMSAAADVDVPEPSPLFWQHFSSRVQESVSAEGQPGQARTWSWTRGWRAWAVPVGAVAALVLAVVIGSRVPAPAPAKSAANRADAASSVDPLPDDPALNLVADLAATMNYDDASELEVGTHVGSADEAVGGLSAGERQELRRLLNEALRQPGD